MWKRARAHALRHSRRLANTPRSINSTAITHNPPAPQTITIPLRNTLNKYVQHTTRVANHLPRLRHAPPLAAALAAAVAAAHATPRPALALKKPEPPPPTLCEQPPSLAKGSPPMLTLIMRFTVLGAYLLPAALAYLLGSREAWLRALVRALSRIGPAGIKWGQWASTRYDLFDEDFCEALGMLTNQAPVHSTAHTERVVARAFGLTVHELFDDFEPQALASGAIGQVHLATLKRDGSRVAIKVQHPGIVETITIDMAILRWLGSLIGSVGGSRMAETVDQFTSNFEAQLDFTEEAANLRAFASKFGSVFWRAFVSFPTPIEGLIDHDVLIETYEPGESVAKFLKRHEEVDGGGGSAAPDVSDMRPLDVSAEDDERLRSSVALCGVQAYLKMVIWDNLIHADLHPGNVLIRLEELSPMARLQRWLVFGDASRRAPHIVFLDAGLAAHFNERIMQSVRDMFRAIVDQDGGRLASAILGLAEKQPYVTDPEGFKRVVRECAERQKAELARGEGRAGNNIRDYLTAVREYHVCLDPTVMVGLMSMIVLEGWQNRLNPQIEIYGCVTDSIGGGPFGYANWAYQKLQDLGLVSEK